MYVSKFLAPSLFGALLVTLSVSPRLAVAQWSTDPTTNQAVCTEPIGQNFPRIINDGTGGVIMTWEDARNDNYDIYAQRFSTSGVAAWTAGGAVVAEQAVRAMSLPALATDLSGGAIVAWEDGRNATLDIFAQRISASGVPLWTVGGVGLCTEATGGQGLTMVVSDGAGGAIVLWSDGRAVDPGIYVQRVSASGVPQWTANGVRVAVGNVAGIVEDGAGGAIIVFDGGILPTEPLKAQRVSSAGALLWGPLGATICSAPPGGQFGYESVIPDGVGGAFVSFVGLAGGVNKVYAQHISSSGATLWTPPGTAVEVCTDASGQLWPKLCSDGCGGVIITWVDYRAGVDIYAQRVSSAGIVLWAPNGVPVCTAPSDQPVVNTELEIISDGCGGAIIGWGDARNIVSALDIYAQRLSPSGAPLWALDGREISVAPGNAEHPRMAGLGPSAAVLVWQDSRDVAATHIYAQEVGTDGNLGSVVGACTVPLPSGTSFIRLTHVLQEKQRPLPSTGATRDYLYPGACVQRALGTWSPKSSPVADSLQPTVGFPNSPGYTDNQPDIAGGNNTIAYTRQDHTGFVGELWQLAPGTENVTSDLCSPQKAFSTDLFFEGGDPTSNLTVPGSFSSVVVCDFPIPAGTGSVYVRWAEYDDLPRGAGYVQHAEYRFMKGGTWYDWRNTSPAGDLRTGSLQAWTVHGDELAEAAQAELVQLRFSMECVPFLAADHNNCTPVVFGVLYDDFRLEVTPGIPPPVFGVFSGSLAQSTFIDGTMAGLNCAVIPCWPGIRGTDLGPPMGIDDNFNSPLGDSIVVTIVSGLGVNGDGINWDVGFDKAVAGGKVIAAFNPGFIPAFGSPQVIYRLFDPATRTWSPWDSTALDADDVRIVNCVTVVMGSRYRWDWPPRDKVAVGAVLPGGFTINGIAAYAALSFLPHGTRIQYYFKAVDSAGGQTFAFSADASALEVENLPTLPGGSIRAPDILEFDVLPGVYPPGPAGSLLAGRTNTPVLNLDGAYSAWSYQQDPVTQALRGLGVRADRYRLLQGLGEGANVGGHELPGQRIDATSNYFPNTTEYGIRDSLATWYRIIIQSGHQSGDWTIADEQDARLLREWWNAETGANGGDRCIFVSGDDVFNAWLNPTYGGAEQPSLAANVFGVSNVTNAWAGTNSTPIPTIDDRFAAASAGPALAAPGTFTYPLDGGCPVQNRFDALVKVGSSDAQNAVFYPNAQVAGIARMSEMDAIPDRDRNKASGYGFSLQFIRQADYPLTSANYAHSGVENRMRVLYKFLTSCRGPRTAAAADTGMCWPCPSPAMTLFLDWAAQSAVPTTGFVTGTWGPLYPIQAGGLATGVDVGEGGEGAPRINKINGNFPNPFNPQTAIRFTSAQAGKAEIRIFSVGGQLVRKLTANVTVGANEVRWNGKRGDGTPLASGVYFYKIVFPDGQTIRAPNHLVLVK